MEAGHEVGAYPDRAPGRPAVACRNRRHCRTVRLRWRRPHRDACSRKRAARCRHARAPQHVEIRYRVMDLGSLDPDFRSFGAAVNAHGQDGEPDLRSPAPTAFDTRSSIETVRCTISARWADYKRGLGINDNGKCAVGPAGQFMPRGFLYSGGVMHDIGTLGGQRRAGINNSGHITGWSKTAGGRIHAFLYAGGSMQDLGTPGADETLESFGTGINDAGRGRRLHRVRRDWPPPPRLCLAGWADGGSRGDRRRQQPGIRDQCAWRHHRRNHHGPRHGDERLPVQPGRHAVHRTCRLDRTRHQCVGLGGRRFRSCDLDGNNPVGHAFLYDGSSLLDLNALLDDSGQGWVVTSANDINDAGQIIGTANAGNDHAVLLTPVAA